jgi:diguanylate cyclase (GGDEF)-like protein
LNRSELQETLLQEIARSAREGNPLAVMMGDLDHFKNVNDTHGHMAGDAVLQEVARRFRSSVRRYDKIVRYGGEEFLFVLPGCDEAMAAQIAERMRATVEKAPVDTSEGLIRVTISIGVATAAPDGEVDPQALISAADAALYRAKQGGRNRVEIAAPGESRKPQNDKAANG